MPPNAQNSDLTPTTIDPSINAWNASFLDALFAQWKADPTTVSQEWQEFFKGFELGASNEIGTQGSGAQACVDSLIYNYRMAGHYAASLDPLGLKKPDRDRLLPESYGLRENQLDTLFDPGHLDLPKPSTLRDIIKRLEQTYCRHIGVEYSHIEKREQRRWLQSQMEPIGNTPTFDHETKRRILHKLAEATTLEHFCATRYIGKKRFSLEGSESLIPMVNELINESAEHGVQVVTIGMAHRGRINVLVNIMRKSYDQLFSEFEESWIEDFTGGGGDVKYHLGYSADILTDLGKPVHLTLAPNPSHLEFGHSVVLGKARARQRIQHDENRSLCIPLLIHGDASFPGQGIVAEMFNMANLEGYTVGGSVHIVVNNQIGFTTNPQDSYSGRYCTDIAKMAGAPIIHVNGNDPEACVHAMQLAVRYRQEFHNDVVVDVWTYRKHGHNESDEPAYTQPLMYSSIKNMIPVTTQYATHLINEEVITKEMYEQLLDEVRHDLEVSQERSKENPVSSSIPPYQPSTAWEGLQGDTHEREVDTTVSLELLEKVTRALGSVPDSFTVHPKLNKLLANRKRTLDSETPFDWGLGELLGFGTLLEEGNAVRLTGQDVERGTFSHRHAVLIDTETAQVWTPLNNISEHQAKLCVHNSPLTENACLGFEYGYSLGDPHMLVVWEAQFGDFVNGAQVIVDQFISSAEVKWRRSTGLVLLLPHGYEGQGPEHSSARLERFLTLCADRNMTVINPTTPAQIFHALRRQITWPFRKPLVVLSPKSLLRHPKAVSTMRDLTERSFQTVLDDNTDCEQVTRVIFCSGKIYYDLQAHREKVSRPETIALVRIEELYPFPRVELLKTILSYTDSEYMWVQEEPENMGAWRYIDSAFRDTFSIDLTRVCRRPSASPAVASSSMHKTEQNRILIEAVGLPTTKSP
ncbi:MAG: 2-oxoglutarate dehydrogenase E1 component [Phycisphaerales bacterium]|jgi:2-oxoglutarate dehydrogenase E1 component|nr:2-oxoglutarate dehydrogenase E1 component [Phycisphaerales bacterium]